VHHGVVIRYLFIHSEYFVLSPIVVRPRKPVAAIQEVTPTASIISMGNINDVEGLRIFVGHSW